MSTRRSPATRQGHESVLVATAHHDHHRVGAIIRHTAHQRRQWCSMRPPAPPPGRARPTRMPCRKRAHNRKIACLRTTVRAVVEIIAAESETRDAAQRRSRCGRPSDGLGRVLMVLCQCCFGGLLRRPASRAAARCRPRRLLKRTPRRPWSCGSGAFSSLLMERERERESVYVMV